jgi:hypothetical protein
VGGCASDLQITQLLEKTRALLAAAENGDTDAIGRQLAARRSCIEEIQAAGGFGSLLSRGQKAAIEEILRLDKEACGRIKRLRDDCAQSVMMYRKKASGVLKYKQETYDLERGQFFHTKSF